MRRKNLLPLSPRSDKRCATKSVWMYMQTCFKKKITLDFTESSIPTSTILNYLDYHQAQGGHLLPWGMKGDNSSL